MATKVKVTKIQSRTNEISGHGIEEGDYFYGKLFEDSDEILYVRTYDEIVRLDSPENVWTLAVTFYYVKVVKSIIFTTEF